MHTQQRWRGKQRSVNRSWACVTVLLPSAHTWVSLCTVLSINRWDACQAFHPWSATLTNTPLSLFLYHTSSFSPRSTHSWLSHTSTLAVWVIRLHFRFMEARPVLIKVYLLSFIEQSIVLYFYPYDTRKMRYSYTAWVTPTRHPHARVQPAQLFNLLSCHSCRRGLEVHKHVPMFAVYFQWCFVKLHSTSVIVGVRRCWLNL